jgi:hypothetical protein
MNTVRNAYIDPADYAGGNSCLCWETANGNRWHFWYSSALLLSDAIAQDSTVYQNPALSIKWKRNAKAPGYFATRQHDASEPRIFAMLQEALRQIGDSGVHAMALDAMRDKRAEVAAAREVNRINLEKSARGPDLFAALSELVKASRAISTDARTADFDSAVSRASALLANILTDAAQ